MTKETAPIIDPKLNALLIGGGSTYGNGKDLAEQGELLSVGLEMTGEQKPEVLIVPSARWIKEGPIDTIVGRFVDHYKSLGVNARPLHGFLYEPHEMLYPTIEEMPVVDSRMPSHDELEERIRKANLIFTLGGDSHRMLQAVWKPYGIDGMMTDAIHSGTIVSGSSAGMLYPFANMQTDASSLKTPEDKDFHVTEGLGLIPDTIAAAHYDTTPKDNPGHPRKEDFEARMADRRELGELGIGVDEHAALQIVNGGILRVVAGWDNGSSPRQVHTIHYRDPSQAPVMRDLGPQDDTFTTADLV